MDSVATIVGDLSTQSTSVISTATSVMVGVAGLICVGIIIGLVKKIKG